MRRRLSALAHWWLRLFIALVLVSPLVGWLQAWMVFTPFGLWALTFYVTTPTVRAAEDEPHQVTPPVRGRWVALNSPASRVPSHGTRYLGQAFAIDITHPSTGCTPTRPGWGLVQPRPEEYPSLGSGVLAVAGGRVVTASDGQRDHRARSSWPGLLYMLTIEALGRQLGGPRFVLGNHVVVEHPDATYSLYAHLRHGSVVVEEGQAVRAGQQLGEVGNTGNSSEPHLHFQLMDRARPELAAGLPFRWAGVVTEPEPDPRWSASGSRSGRPPQAPGLPGSGQVFATTG